MPRNQRGDIPNPMPDSAKQHGENPARYLVERIEPDNGHGTTGQLIFARIQGIQSIALCRYWVAIERWIARVNDREPREDVIEALGEREKHLDDHGEGIAQDGLTPEGRRERAAEIATESVAVLVDEDGNEVPWSRQQAAVVGASR